MEISKEFTVTRPVQDVWDLFQDVPTVVSCLPGAELLEDQGNGQYSGSIETRLGPIKAKFEGKASVASDHANMSGTIEGEGVDRRGGSRGSVAVRYKLTPSNGGTSVMMGADISLSGTAAQFGRSGLIEELSNQIIGDFVVCLESKLDSGSHQAPSDSEPPTIKMGSLLLRSFWAWLKRIFGGRPSE